MLGRRLRRFFRSPKGYLLLALIPLLLIAAPSAGSVAAARTVIAAVLGATSLELGCVRLRTGEWAFPSSALLSGLIVALVLSAQEPWYVALAAGVLASASKHLLRLRRGHIFNPAALGLLAVYFLFGSGQSWWGSLPGLPGVAYLAVAAAGWIVADRANKLPAALAFSVFYVCAFTGTALTGQAAAVSNIFRPPFVNMALFFACFMVTDPPTSPVPFPAQMVYGAAIALVSFESYLATHGLYYLLVGLLVANLGYALWQQARSRQRRPAPQPATPDLHGRAPGLLLGAGIAAAATAAVLLLAGGLAVAHRLNGGAATVARSVASTAPPATAAAQSLAPAATAPPAPGSAPASAASVGSSSGSQVLNFDDRFTGSLNQSQGPNGNTLDFDLTGSGQRPVRLTMHLVLSGGRGRRNRAIENHATLFDAQGRTLCQGQVTQLDEESFSATCTGSGGEGNPVELTGTITSGLTSQIEGELQAAPLDD